MSGTWPQRLSWVLGYEAEKRVLVSPLRREECIRRLRENIGWPILDPTEVMGFVGDTSFRLRRHRWYRYPPTVVRGTLIEESRQTRINCRFGAPLACVAWLAAWLIVSLIVFATFLLSSVANGPSARYGGAGVILLVMTGLAPLFCRLEARADEGELVKFLTKTLDACEIPGPHAG